VYLKKKKTPKNPQIFNFFFLMQMCNSKTMLSSVVLTKANSHKIEKLLIIYIKKTIVITCNFKPNLSN